MIGRVRLLPEEDAPRLGRTVLIPDRGPARAILGCPSRICRREVWRWLREWLSERGGEGYPAHGRIAPSAATDPRISFPRTRRVVLRRAYRFRASSWSSSFSSRGPRLDSRARPILLGRADRRAIRLSVWCCRRGIGETPITSPPPIGSDSHCDEDHTPSRRPSCSSQRDTGSLWSALLARRRPSAKTRERREWCD